MCRSKIECVSNIPNVGGDIDEMGDYLDVPGGYFCVWFVEFLSCRP